MIQRIRWYKYLRRTKPWTKRKAWFWAGYQVRSGYRC